MASLLVSAVHRGWILQVSNQPFPAVCSHQSLADGLHRVIFPRDVLWTRWVALASPLSLTLLLGMPVPCFGAFLLFPLQAQLCSLTALAPSRGYFPIPWSTLWTRCRLLVPVGCGQQGWGLAPERFLQCSGCAGSGTRVVR